MKYTLALVQMSIAWQEPEANFKKMEVMLQRAVTAGADVVVFPEYVLSADLPNASEGAAAHGKYRAKFRALAKKYQVDLIPGSSAEKVGSKFYNTAYYIDREGNVLGRYRKINLWHSERATMSSGKSATVFQTRFGKAGLIICWDLIFPEVFRKMVKQDVELVYCPSYWCANDAGAGKLLEVRSEEKLVDATCVSRAFENEIVLTYCNPAGSAGVTDGSAPFGHSQISVPFQGSIGKLDHDQEDILIRQVDTDILRTAEEVYKIRVDLT